ncbi:SDR family oxidoreductase [Hyphomicrobiales bacterium 4NK60-0047b]|jgi:NAD(P)-dependent dehydrogenase (short-subunit alcohol dehydrogenase family)
MSKVKSIALITGAGKRIGHHLALSLAKEGWSIAAHYNQSEEGALELNREIKKFGGKAISLKADLKNDKEVIPLIAACQAELGLPNLLINCASVFHKDELKTLESKTFDEQMAINLKAPLLLSKAFAEAHQKALSGGDKDASANIINITDQRVQKLNPTFFSYTLSKVGLSTATITMAQSLAPNIRVNAIAPGPVLQSIHQTEDEFKNECKGTLLEAGTTPDQIFETVKFILQTNSLTGETITLAGGQHLKW